MIARKWFATFGIAAAIATGGTLLPASTPSAEAYATNWGAIAFDYSGRVGYTRGDYPTESSAVRAVKARCGAQCGFISFYNSCGAVAYRYIRGYRYRRTIIGTARGAATPAAAINGARRQAGPGSFVRAWACTTRWS